VLISEPKNNFSTHSFKWFLFITVRTNGCTQFYYE
jgi:hypothetical protein